MNRPSYKLAVFSLGTALAAAWLLQGCFLMPAQKADEIFADATLPAALEAIANPEPLADAAGSESARPRVRVAVIDNGVDYRHPYLGPRMAYRRDENGRIVGTGSDVLGRDAWPHPNLIDGDVFAFGARITEDGRIADPLDNPLEEISRLNERFQAILAEKLAARTSELEGTLFTKADATMYHFLGVYEMLQDKVRIRESIRTYKQIGFQLDANSRTEGPEVVRDQLEELLEGSLRALFDLPWTMTAHGLPTGLANNTVSASALRGMEVILETAESAFSEFDAETGFTERYFPPYFEYRFAQLMPEERGSSREDLNGRFASDLMTLWYRTHSDFRGSDPIHRTAGNFCEGLSDEEFELVTSAETPAGEKAAFVRGRIDRSFEVTERFHRMRLASDNTSEQDKRRIERALENIARYRSWIRQVIAERGIETFYCDPAALSGDYRFASEYRDYGRRVDHPYLDGSSSSVSHGSHVSGIILAQEENSRIVPVRVITSSRTTTDEIERPVKERFLHEFREWLGQPLVNRAVTTLLSEEIDFSEAENAEERTELVMERVGRVFPAAFESDRLDYFFFNEIREAIRYVGREKVKIANVSLGTEFSRSVPQLGADEDQEFEQVFRFLTYEFFKYSVARQLENDAPGTLFVIAAGNSGAWLDGRSRSGLPCDLSSPFLEAHRQASDEAVPNNRVNNILCVGSIGAEHELSAFSNILLTQVPFVVSMGESIPSAVRSEDCSGVAEKVAEILGPSPATDPHMLDDADFERFLREQGKLTAEMSDMEKEKVKRVEMSRYGMLTGLLRYLTNMAEKHECIAGDYFAMAHMSGTSMASPAVAGKVADMVAAKLEGLGLSDEQAYDHPELSPAALIRSLTETSPRFGGSSIISELRKVVDLNEFPHEGFTPAFELRRIELGSTENTTLMLKRQ